MPWLPLYMDDVDAQQIAALLNSDASIAFIVSQGPGRWVAQHSLTELADARFCIWHIPSGPLPLLGPGGASSLTVGDPWAGWAELRSGFDRRQPYFGAGHPGVIWWNLRTKSRSAPDRIGLSSFEWIGNHYRVIGSAADTSTEQWWAGLRKSLRKQEAGRIPRTGPLDGPDPEIWAMPSALAKIVSGVPRDDNP